MERPLRNGVVNSLGERRKTYNSDLVSLQRAYNGDWRTEVGPKSVTSLTGIQYDEDGNPVAHNYIPNSEGVGGAVGTCPTGWNDSQGIANGITTSLIGAGTGYTTWRIHGTASVWAYPEIIFSGYGALACTNGQTFTISADVELISGNLPGQVNKRLVISDASYGYLGQYFGDVTLQSVTATIAYATAARMNLSVLCIIPSGATVDFTIRISKPQLSKSATKLPYTPTYGSAVFMPYVSPTKGLRASGAWTNLFTNVTPTTEIKTLTAQKYCLQVFGTGASATCSYGTATESTPLIFTATAGNTTFTPTSCIRWMLVADGGYVRDYIPPGITNSASSSTTGGNGTNTALDAKMTAALSAGGRFTAVAVVYVGAGSGELPFATYHNILSHNNTANPSLCYTGKSADGLSNFLVASYDGTTARNILSIWNKDEIHLKVVQTNAAGTQFRVGNRRYISSLVPIGALTWGAWTAYDGSLGPLTHLRLALNGTIPLGFLLTSLSGKSLSDADILKQLRYVK